MANLPTARGDNVVVLYKNELTGRRGATVDSDSEDASGNMGAENLLTEVKADAYRSGSVATRSGAGTPEILITYALPTARSFNFVAPEWTNLQLPWRADFYAGDPDAAGTLVDTTDWTEPIVVSESGDFPVGQVPAKLGPDAERVAELAADYRLRSFQTLAAPTAATVDHVRFRIDCTTGANGSVDFVQVSMFYGGLLFRPHINMALGTSIDPVFRGKTRRTAGNAKLGYARTLSKSVTFDLSYLSDDEADELVTDWMEREGELARVFVWREPQDSKRRFFYGFGGAFTGTAEAFNGLVIEEHEGDMDGIIVAKSVQGIKVEETT